MTTIKAKDVTVGTRLDLEGDEFADTDKTNAATRAGFEFEYSEVIEPPTFETPDCVVVHTSDGSFGFPPDHEIQMQGDHVLARFVP